jgi:hypothetical protein
MTSIGDLLVIYFVVIVAGAATWGLWEAWSLSRAGKRPRAAARRLLFNLVSGALPGGLRGFMALFSTMLLINYLGLPLVGAFLTALPVGGYLSYFLLAEVEGP